MDPPILLSRDRSATIHRCQWCCRILPLVIGRSATGRALYVLSRATGAEAAGRAITHCPHPDCRRELPRISYAEAQEHLADAFRL